MIPLLFAAFVIGFGLATYEFSPRARAWLDAHLGALGGARDAHHAADAHLVSARTSRDPALAVQHAGSAATANRQAALRTIEAARTAMTEQQQEAASRSAAMVVEREDEIADVVTEAHLDAAEMQPDPGASVEHVLEALAANQASAKRTAAAAEVARTQEARQIAARSASKVTDREGKIAAALAKLGVGQCGVRSYRGVTPQVKDALLARLHEEGMAVTGDNPWDIQTHQYDVRLRAAWDSGTRELRIIVMSGEGGYLGLVTCSAIWGRVDPIVREIIGT